MQVLNVLRTLQFVKLTDIMTKEEIDFLLNSYPDYSTFPWEKNPKTPSLVLCDELILWLEDCVFGQMFPKTTALQSLEDIQKADLGNIFIKMVSNPPKTHEAIFINKSDLHLTEDEEEAISNSDFSFGDTDLTLVKAKKLFEECRIVNRWAIEDNMLINLEG